MSLQKQAITVRFGGGVETKADGKTVPTTKLLALENGIFTRGITITKRKGYDALPKTVLGQATPYGEAHGIAARGDELILFADDRAYSYVPGASAWSRGEQVQSVMQSDRALLKTPSAQVRTDYAAAGSVGIVAWEDSRGGVYFAVVTDDDAGQVVQGPALLSSTGARPRCVESGGNLIVLWAEATLGQVKCLLVNPSAPDSYDAGQFPRVLIDDLVTTTPNYDACSVAATADTNASAAIAWNSTNGVRVGWLTSASRLGSPATGWPSVLTIDSAAVMVVSSGMTVSGLVAGPVINSCPWLPTEWAITWSLAGESYVMVANGKEDENSTVVADFVPAVALGVSGVTNVANAFRAIATSPDAVESWLEVRASPVRDSTVTRKQITGNGTLTSDTLTTRGAALASKGWTDPGDGISDTSAAYVTLVHDVPLFAVYLTIRHTGECVARTLPGIGGHAQPETIPHLPSVTGDSTREYRWAATYRTQLEAVDLDQFTEEGARLVTFAFDDDAAFQTALANRTLYLGAACPLLYDGQGWYEHQPHYAADWEDGETLHENDTAAGGDITDGTRAYVFTYDYTLATGELVRGAASKPYIVTTSSTNTTYLTIPTLRCTRMSSASPSPTGRADCRINVWRTIAGDASVYYRVTGTSPSPGGGSSIPGANYPLINDTTADTKTFADQMSDDDLIKQEPLYTNGGILSNDPPAATGVLASGKNRLFATDPSDGSTVRYSQERADGYAIEWPADLLMQLPPDGGDVTAIGVMDDTVVMFKHSAIYIVSGPGPLANPEAGGGWTAPALVTSDVGCISQRSLAVTPNGLVFQSAKGIYLFDRSRQTSYIGAPVEAYNDQTIARAAAVPDTTQIRFLTADGSTLLWDYFFDQWSTFGNHEGVDSTVTGGAYHYLRTDGRVFVESDTRSDAGSAIALDMSTAWIHLQPQLQGFQRIYHVKLIGNWRSPHTLRMQYRVDYRSDWSPPIPFDATDPGGTAYGEGNYGDGPYGGESRPAYEWRWHVGLKCEAFQLRFRDHEAVGEAGASFEINELLITGGIKGPAYKVPASRSA